MNPADPDILSRLRTQRINDSRRAFTTGVEWATQHLLAAASLVEVDQMGDVKMPDGSTRTATIATGSPAYAKRLRGLAEALSVESQTAAPQMYPDWKE